MDDLQAAVQRLKDKKLSLVFVKNSKTLFKTNKEGLSGFLKAIEELNGSLSGASAADRTIGKAAALLCAFSEVKAVFAVTMSQGGLKILDAHAIHYEYENLVPIILNRKKTDKCPFEKLVDNIADYNEAYKRIREFCHS